MEIEDLVGYTILSAQINPTKDLVVFNTDKTTLYLTWEGDCCAKCYLAHVSGVKNLIGSQIYDVETLGWMTQKNYDEDSDRVQENMGTKFKTSKGYVTFESRLEHNGYYSGNILISDVAPIDLYGEFKFVETNLKVLIDF